MIPGVLPTKKQNKNNDKPIVSSDNKQLNFLINENILLKKQLQQPIKESEINKLLEENEKLKKNIKEKEENSINSTISKLKKYDDKLNYIRIQRDKLLKDTLWIKEKYECQLREKQIGMSTAIDMPQKKFEQWFQYWKDLRNLPNKIENGEIDINNVVFPKQPT
jgi:hypothetical protein